jgi:hypothetical protein
VEKALTAPSERATASPAYERRFNIVFLLLLPVSFRKRELVYKTPTRRRLYMFLRK